MGRDVDVQGLLANRPAKLPSLLENTRAMEAGKTGLGLVQSEPIQSPTPEQGKGLMPIDSKIIKELSGVDTGQLKQMEREIPSVILKAQRAERMHYFAPQSVTPAKSMRVIERMRRMGASTNEQIMFLELLNLHGSSPLARALWDRYFTQN